MNARALRALVLALLVALPVVLQSFVVMRADFGLGDFRAFYCASRVALAHADPYRDAPLHACERALGPASFYDAHGDVTVPAPLPGYTLALLAPFALAPFSIAATLWTALLALCALLAARATQRLTSWSFGTSLGVYALSLAATSLPYGELVPIVVAALAWSAVHAREGRDSLAALAACITAIEPHVGLPACLALAIAIPRTRLLFAAATAVAGALSFAFVGGRETIVYLTQVLPAHALAEATRDTQYSLTAVLAALGVGQERAVVLGSLSYALTCASGIVLAALLARRYGDRAFLPTVPAASALLGGSFIHLTQMPVAIPALAVLIAHTRFRTAGIAAMLLLAVPWAWATSPALGLAAAFPVAWVVWELSKRDVRATALAALVAGGAIVALNALAAHETSPATRAIASVPAIDPSLAQASWARFTRSYSARNDLASWIERAPTWFALAGAGALAWLSARSRRAEARTPRRPRDTVRTRAAARHGAGAGRMP